MVFCDNCGVKNAQDALQCEGCGEELILTIYCPSCGATNSELNEFCVQCEEQLDHPDEVFGLDEDDVLFDLSRLKFLTDEELEELQYAVMEELSNRELGDDSSLEGSSDDEKQENLRLTLIFGQGKKDVTFELLVGILTLDSFVEGYGFSKESLQHIEVHGLQVPNGPQVMFKPSKLFPFPHIEAKGRLKDGMTLRVLFTDAREVDVKQLTPAELGKLKKEFTKMDSNNSGTLTVDDVRTFFENKKTKAGRNRKEAFTKRLAVFRNKKSSASLADQMDKHMDQENQRVELLIHAILAYDLDGDGQITQDEYIAGRAASLVAERNK